MFKLRGLYVRFLAGWKTVVFMGAVSVVGVLQTVDWATLVPPQYSGVALAVVGFVGMLLRAATTTPIGVGKP